MCKEAAGWLSSLFLVSDALVPCPKTLLVSFWICRSQWIMWINNALRSAFYPRLNHGGAWIIVSLLPLGE